MSRMIGFFNEQLVGYQRALAQGIKVSDFIDYDPKKISWSRGLVADVEKNKEAKYERKNIRPCYYRPFTMSHIYFHRQFNDMIYRMPIIFPESRTHNLTICINGPGGSGFSAIITNALTDLNFQHSGGQCFPLYTYSSAEPKPEELSLGDAEENGRQLNISAFAQKACRAVYKDTKINKEDIFYYVYGILHSPEYKARFAADLTKILPRIPLAEDFWTFSQAGRKLAEIHLNYETAKLYPVKEQRDELVLDEKKLYLVDKMRFGKSGKEVDKTKIQYNSHITLTDIPLEAYEYVVNGKSAIEWIMDRYQFSKDKDSQIVNNPNDWAHEHNEPKYILNLLKSIVTVSIETMKIIKNLPSLNERKVGTVSTLATDLQNVRHASEDPQIYAVNLVVAILSEAGGSLAWNSLISAYVLTVKPNLMKQRATADDVLEVETWAKRFNEIATENDLIPAIKTLGSNNLDFQPDGDSFRIQLQDGPRQIDDPEIRNDAKLVLKVLGQNQSLELPEVKTIEKEIKELVAAF